MLAENTLKLEGVGWLVVDEGWRVQICMAVGAVNSNDRENEVGSAGSCRRIGQGLTLEPDDQRPFQCSELLDHSGVKLFDASLLECY